MTWECAGVKPIPETKPMDQASHEQLGLGVLASDAAHSLAALSGREGVHWQQRINQRGGHAQDFSLTVRLARINGSEWVRFRANPPIGAIRAAGPCPPGWGSRDASGLRS